MPTARELLEEADALMRRNRSPQGDDIPLLTDSVPVLTEAHVLRGRGAASRGGVPVAPATHVAQQPDSDSLDSIPTLTEAVEEEVDEAAAPNDGGEPSDWLAREVGEPSITGEVPDSVLVVPPPDETDLADEEPFFDDDAPPPLPSSGVPETVEFDDVDETEEIELVAPPHDAVEAAFEEELAGHARAAAPGPTGDVPFESTAEKPAVDRLADVPHFASEADDEDVPTIIETVMEEDEAPEELAATAEPVAFTPLAPEPPVSAPLPAPLMPARIDDSTKWEGVAEEIRMQVLQRIDIFTDTGLREQLALRLQPIVDRASADLVATINQHVGDLLRAYVAEAIEREIESWRRNH